MKILDLMFLGKKETILKLVLIELEKDSEKRKSSFYNPYQGYENSINYDEAVKTIDKELDTLQKIRNGEKVTMKERREATELQKHFKCVFERLPFGEFVVIDSSGLWSLEEQKQVYSDLLYVGLKINEED